MPPRSAKRPPGLRLARTGARSRASEDDEPRRLLAVGRATEYWVCPDIEAFDADTAVIMSIGNTADMFRIYRTENGGQTWTLTFQNTEPTAFYDCMAFFDKHRGLRSRIRSTDGSGSWRRATGRSWQIIDADMPPALPGEFGVRRQRAVPHRCWWTGCVARRVETRSRGSSTRATADAAGRSRTHRLGALQAADLRACLPGSASRDRSRKRLCPRRRLGGHACATNDGGATWQLNQDTPDGSGPAPTGSPVATSSSSGRAGATSRPTRAAPGASSTRELRRRRLRRRVRLLAAGAQGRVAFLTLD